MTQPLNNNWYDARTVVYQKDKDYLILYSDGTIEEGKMTYLRKFNEPYPVLYGEINGDLSTRQQ